MSNKEWDKISYKQSYEAKLALAQEKYKEFMETHDIVSQNYQPLEKEEKGENTSKSMDNY